MLDIRLIREKPDFVRERLATRGGEEATRIDELLKVDVERRKTETELQGLQSERNRLRALTRGMPHLHKLREIMEHIYALFDRRCRTLTAKYEESYFIWGDKKAKRAGLGGGLAATLATIGRLSLPYFRSEDRWPGRLLLAAVIAIELSIVAITVILNQWYNRFYNTLQDRNWEAFLSATLFFCRDQANHDERKEQRDGQVISAKGRHEDAIERRQAFGQRRSAAADAARFGVEIDRRDKCVADQRPDEQQ